jgi:signal transduction histidine kinase
MHIEPIQAKAIVMRAVADIRPLAARGQNTFTAKISGNLGVIETDAARLLYVLQQVLSSACTLTQGGFIVLDAYRERTFPQERAGAPSPILEQIVFQVSDTGIGMTTDQIDAIFADSSPLDSSHTRQYDGKGLALARSLCHRMGGTIRVASAPGQGSVFTICLPVTKPAHAYADANRELRASSLPLRSRRQSLVR